MKALSVRQPWADAILLGKDVENRSRYFSHRGLLLIHAARKIDMGALDDRRILELPASERLTGHLIGVVTVFDCVRDHPSRWAEPGDYWHLILSNPRPLLRPVPYRGQLNIFDVCERPSQGQLACYAFVLPKRETIVKTKKARSQSPIDKRRASAPNIYVKLERSRIL